MLMCDFLQEILGDIACNDLGERCVAGKSIAAKQAADRLFRDKLVSRIRGVNRLERRIVFGSEKGEGCRQRSCANPRHNVELGPVTPCRPADEQASTEGPIGSTARNRKK